MPQKTKKGKYIYRKTKEISFDNIYCVDKDEMKPLIEKYHSDNGDPLLFTNSPICSFAESYFRDKVNFTKTTVKHPFILYSFERYGTHTDAYRKELQDRIISIVNSVEKYGYAKGKYSDKIVCVCVRKDGGYYLISGKHRAAACVAVGMKKIKCNVYKEK